MGYTLITGATSDIGRQICHILEKSGYSLLLTDWSEEALVNTISELDPQKSHKYITLDLSNINDSKKYLTTFLKEHDIRIENVVYAAGVFTVKPVKILNYEFVKRNFDIAVFSTIMISQVLTSRKYNGASLKSIVFLSSISAVMGTKGYTIYGAVKAAMLGAMKSMASEFAPRVRVNAVLPGGVRTKTTAFLYEGIESSNPRYLLGNGEVSDIANMIEFLLSNKSKWITGQEFIVDGGFLCN